MHRFDIILKSGKASLIIDKRDLRIVTSADSLDEAKQLRIAAEELAQTPDGEKFVSCLKDLQKIFERR